jgi:DNA-binding transcriptional ArsR family regulator
MSRSSPAYDERARDSDARVLCAHLRAIADLSRLQILRRLAQEQEMSVTQLALALRVSQPLLSWHLGVLRRADLVTMRREGRLAWYSINYDVLHSLRLRLAAWVESVPGDGLIEEGSEYA